MWLSYVRWWGWRCNVPSCRVINTELRAKCDLPFTLVWVRSQELNREVEFLWALRTVSSSFKDSDYFIMVNITRVAGAGWIKNNTESKFYILRLSRNPEFHVKLWKQQCLVGCCQETHISPPVSLANFLDQNRSIVVEHKWSLIYDLRGKRRRCFRVCWLDMHSSAVGSQEWDVDKDRAHARREKLKSFYSVYSLHQGCHSLLIVVAVNKPWAEEGFFVKC